MRGEPFGAKAPPGGAGGFSSRAGGGRLPVWSDRVGGRVRIGFHWLSGDLSLTVGRPWCGRPPASRQPVLTGEDGAPST